MDGLVLLRDTLKGTRDEYGGRIIGTVTNRTGRKLRYAEISFSLYDENKPDDSILAIVEFLDGGQHRVHYVSRPGQREPDFGVTSVNCDFGELVVRGVSPDVTVGEPGTT